MPQACSERSESERDHAPLVRADALQQHPKAGMDDAVAEEQEQQQERKDEIIQDDRVIEIESAVEITVPADVQAVVAAVLVQADPEEIDHLTERQGDHDEIDAGRAQRHKADHECRQGGGEERNGEMDDTVADAVKAQDAYGVGGADAEIGSMAKTD